MATEAQIVANRLNAQKSTGPHTPEGKAVVAQNAVKHGLSGRLDVIKGEDQAEFDRHRGAMLDELAPVGAMESMLAERVVSLSWRLKRVERIENEVFDALLADRNTPLAKLVQSLESKAAGRPKSDCEGESELDLGRAVIKDFSNSRVLDRLLMYERRIEHSLYKTMAELQRLRLVRELDGPAEKPATGASAAVGSVPVAASGETQHLASLRRNDEREEPATLAAQERSCKTKPISSRANEGQLSDDKEVMADFPESRLGETKPISPAGGTGDMPEVFDAPAGQRLSCTIGTAEGKQVTVQQL